MNPRLVFLTGPLEGTTYVIVDDETLVGRDRANQVWINDLSVSRRHSLIKREDGTFTVTDLDSSNGTYVNGVPVKQRALEHGDFLSVGDSLVLFLLHEKEDAPPSGNVQLDEKQVSAETTLLLRRQDALYLHPEKVIAALPPSARLAHDLNVLLRVSTEINSMRDIESFKKRLLEIALEVAPAERAAVLLREEGQDELGPAVGWSRLGGAEQPLTVSRAVVDRVMQEGVSVLSSEVVEEASGHTDSPCDRGAQSLICVPLLSFDHTLGVLYLDTTDPAARFDEANLQLLTAVAAIAAAALENLRRLESLEDENRLLKEEARGAFNIIGESPRMRKVYEVIARVAPTDSTVLVGGESGTGKELVARALHLNGPRANYPFIAVNCAVLTESLLESELFGHEKGAFTGAISQKKGKLEAASGGTVFLDEVGELAQHLQAKLLRVLQEREFERVGGTRPIKVDIRLIAATNKNLEEEIQKGNFRQDLYYRLNVVSIVMPPLRERREDIPLLANYFISRYSVKCKRRIKGISHQARSYLMAYPWPGNVRELENAIERAAVLGSTEVIQPDDLPEAVLDAGPAAGSMQYFDALKEAKKKIVLDTIGQANGSYTEAAKALGIHPNNLHRLIRSLGLKPLLKRK